MKAAEIIPVLEQKFADKIRAKNLDAIDPFVVVAPSDLLEVARFLRDDSRLRFDILNCLSGVDYLEPDAKKAPKAGFEPHLEVVYHLSSFSNRSTDPATGKERLLRFVVKVLLSRWKDNKPGELPEVPSVSALWAGADWH